ncbi:Structural maintenance of chromosomes protein 4 [Mycoemilia scoparia]|uniref:Structural maintenance of chromosomes protein n=1 Tax=Mycoemilia scoparia TaxID=417184 RepID=A0A9W7ZUS0_9FUNG|nr:Structural maintenance of chromosomes protein 4 [Mycoemilia scoparia]
MERVKKAANDALKQIGLSSSSSSSPTSQIPKTESCESLGIDSFSAIVGPNGSGKSNVIDSLLFVFGFRASKIRQGKLSELIHNSKNAGNITSCTVEIHFKEITDRADSEDYDEVPNSKLVISRSAYRNNTSKYFINGTVSTQAEVVKLLKGKGVDLDHKRFLILQGEVESISQMKPKAQNEHEEGLLEYLEDIIGTSKYKDQIAKASKDVDTLNDERAVQLNLAKIAERDLASMEDKKNEAVQYIEAENQLAKKKSALYQYRLHESNVKIKEVENSYNKVKDELDKEISKFNKYREKIKSLEQNYSAAQKEYESLEKKAKEAGKELSKFEREDVQIQENRKHVKNKLKKLVKIIEKDEHDISGLRNSIGNYNHDIENGNKEVKELEERLKTEQKALEKIADGLKGKTDKFSAEIDKKQRELEPWNEKIAAKQSQLDIVRTEISMIKAKMEEGNNQVEKAREELAKLRQDRAEKDQELNDKIVELENLNEEISNLEGSISEIEEQEKSSKEEFFELKNKESEARESIKSTESESNVLKALLQQRDNGNIKGIYGRLGSLGTIDDKYDVAISTAAPSLSNIVVDTVETGQKCVEFLRKNNVGWAKFIMLSALPKNRDIDRPNWVPNGVTRLIDLVQPSHERFMPAFFHAIGNTLVADNLGMARKIAYSGKRVLRVVTLDGNLISASGSMSGGGNRQMRGAMSSRKYNHDMTPAKLATIVAKRENAEATWRENSTRLSLQSEKLEQLQRKKSEFEVLLPKLEMSMKLVHEQIQAGKKHIKQLQSEAKSPDKDDEKRFEELTRSEAMHLENIADLKSQCSQIEEAIKELQEQIMQVGGVQLRVQKTKVDDLKDRINTITDQLSSWERSLVKAQSDISRIERSMAKNETERNGLTEQIAEITKSIEANTHAAVEVKQAFDEAQLKVENKHDEMEKIKEELGEISEEYAEMRTREVDMKHRLQGAERSLADARKSANYWESELGRLELQPLPDLSGKGEEKAKKAEKMEIEEEDDDDDQEESDKMDVENEDDDIEEEEEDDNDDSQALALPTLTEKELQDVDVNELDKEVTQLKASLQRSKPNLSILGEYIKRARDYNTKSKSLEEITKQRDDAQNQFDELRKRRLDEFMAGFNKISYRLKEMYQMITMGGNAELELVDSLDPFSEGLVFSVMPPKKSWKNIANLSGGEKTLSSLALVFALHQFKPTPIYVMDEIDAALDFRNVSIVANYIKERTRDAQFIIISLRNNMFELADRLVGIYKTDNKTKSIAINPKVSAHLLAAAAASATKNSNGASGAQTASTNA